MSVMMPFDQAQATIVSACGPGPRELVVLSKAVGAVLAQDIIAREDLVPFARSAMDGYAVRSSDVSRLPTTLPIAGAVYAAAGGDEQLRPGTAMAIATGAAIPAGADCVIPFEHVTVESQCITVTRSTAAGRCVFPPGDDARRGELLLARGTQVTPACIGLLAAAGLRAVEVYRRPTVAIVCGGDELVGVDEEPGHGQVRDSNGVMLAAAITAAGGHALTPVRLRDRASTVREALDDAFAQADVVVTTGGASVGERDFVKAACTELGVDFFFRSVALRPAKPTGFGQRGDAFVAVLPGNPAAAFVALHEFVRPAIRALCGHADPLLPRVRATLHGVIRAKPGRHFAAFAAVSVGTDGFIVTPLENQCSSLTRTAVDAAGLIIVPPGLRTYAAFERVDVDIFDWTRVTTQPRITELRAAGELTFA
jgi:molybdopterin molybdotransferase